MEHLGDITKILGAFIEPVDVVTFGAPCQDLSVAGTRSGMKHSQLGHGETTRSGLFMEAVRIIKEMRIATHGEYPKYAIWENVPGAFSSNKGEDFRIVLEELAKIKDETALIPEPSKGKWLTAGSIVGDLWSIAWRTHCASKWGVPQRRRRISVIMDFRGHSASEILFERQGLRGYFEESRYTWERDTTCFKASTGVSDSQLRLDSGTCHEDVGAKVFSLDSLSSNSMKSSNPHSGFFETDTIKTLDTSDQRPDKNQGGVCIAQPIALQANAIDRADTAGCNGKGWNDETMYTLTALDRHCVMAPQVFECHSQDSRYAQLEKVSESVAAKYGTGGGNVPLVAQPYAIGNGQADQTGLHDKALTLNCMHDQQAVIQPINYQGVLGSLTTTDAKYAGNQMVYEGKCIVHTNRYVYLVRRITPKEAERLQGLPDGYTDIGDWIDSKGKTRKGEQADSHRYKALGNSIALPFWYWLFQQMKPHLPEKPTLGSLFSGIGGFELCWESVYANHLIRWASEIEDYAIAVTEKQINFK